MTTRRSSRLRLVHSARRGRAARLRCTRTFGMNPRELRRELNRLANSGWQLWELAYRFDCTCEDSINTNTFGGAA